MLKLIEKILFAWAEGARRAGLALIILFAIATAAAAFYAASNLKVNTDTSAMLDPALEFQQRTSKLAASFPQIKNDIIVVVEAQNPDEASSYLGALGTTIAKDYVNFTDHFSASTDPFFRQNGLLYLSVGELEQRLTNLSQASSLIETLIQSPTIGTFFSTLASNDALAAQSDLGEDTLNQLYGELADVLSANLEGERKPFSWLGALDSEDDEDATIIRTLNATPVLDYSRLQPAKGAVNALRSEIDVLNETYGGRVDAYVTGDPALRVEELEAVTQGIGKSMALSLVLATFLLLICYRSAGMAFLTLSALIMTLVLTSAFAAFAVGELNLVSVAFTVLLIGLGLDFAIHLLLHIQERRADGEDNKMALHGALHEVGPALALAAPTTALAFLSFVPTKFDGIAQLGIIAGSGVIIAFLVSVTFLPAALCFFKSAPKKHHSGRIRGFFHALKGPAGPIAALTVLIGIASLFLMPQVRFDADQMALRNPAAPSVVGFNRLFDDPDTSPYRLLRLASSSEDARETEEKAAALSGVNSVMSLLSFVPENQDDKLDLIDFSAATLAFALSAEPSSTTGPPASEGIDKLIAQLSSGALTGSRERLHTALIALRDRNDKTLFQRAERDVFAYWPDLISLLRDQLAADYVDLDSLPGPLRARYLSDTGEWRVDILPTEDIRKPDELRKFVTSVENEFPDLAGGAYQSKKAGETISRAMLQATMIALIVISIFLWLLVRRVKIVLLVLFPLLLAAVLTAATGVLLDIPFNYANVIVLPLLIGIGVDSGIHLVMRHDQIEAGEGIHGTSTPRAILFSALTTVASFGSLMLSPHRGTASMGEILSIALAFTLICTLIVLPAVFNYEARRTAR